MQAILDYGNSNKINLKYNDFDLYLYNLVFADGSYKMNRYMGYMGIKPIYKHQIIMIFILEMMIL